VSIPLRGLPSTNRPGFLESTLLLAQATAVDLPAGDLSARSHPVRLKRGEPVPGGMGRRSALQLRGRVFQLK
jgi:hypothetical protein